MCDTTHTLWKKKTQGGFLGALMGIGRVVARLAPRIARTAIRHAPKLLKRLEEWHVYTHPNSLKKASNTVLQKVGKWLLIKL